MPITEKHACFSAHLKSELVDTKHPTSSSYRQEHIKHPFGREEGEEERGQITCLSQDSQKTPALTVFSRRQEEGRKETGEGGRRCSKKKKNMSHFLLAFADGVEGDPSFCTHPHKKEKDWRQVPGR